MNLRILAPAVVLGVLLLPACGGGGEEPAATSREPTDGTGAPAGAPTTQELFEAVQSDPDNPDKRHAFAVALHRTGRREESVEHFERVAEMLPDTQHLVELGVVYASVSRMEDAETAFKRALEISPGHAITLHHLGNLARRRGARAEAISLYRQAVENQPDYLMARYHLADTLREDRQFREAYRSYEQVVELEPRGPGELSAFDDSLFQLAALDLQMGATERAVEFLRVVIDTNPDHPQAHFMLGQALVRLGREEEARKELEIHQRLEAARDDTPPG